MVSDVSGSCLEHIVSYMYSGSLILTQDTANVMLMVAKQLEISSLMELCQNFIADPQHPDPSGEKEHSGLTVEERAEDCTADAISLADKAAIKLEKESSVDEVINTVLICPTAPLTRTTRSSSRKLQSIESGKTSQVIKSSSNHLTGCRKRRKSPETGEESSQPKRSVPAVSSVSGKKNDPDWKPTMDNCSRSPVHSYNTRKHSDHTVDKPVSSSTVSIQNVHRKHLVLSSTVSHLAGKPPTSVTTNHSTSSYAVRGLPAWWKSRTILLSARVFLAKRMKASDDGLFRCRQCQVKPVVSRSRLSAHILRRHRQRHLCFLCHQKFFSYISLVRHRNNRHRLSYMGFIRHGNSTLHYLPNTHSRICKKVGVSSRSGPPTAQSLHNKCGWCGLKFSSRSKLIEHREAVHRRRIAPTVTPVCRRVARDWNCAEKDCGMKFKHKDKLRLHMAEHHPSVIFSCPECRFKTQVEHILRRY